MSPTTEQLLAKIEEQAAEIEWHRKRAEEMHRRAQVAEGAIRSIFFEAQRLAEIYPKAPRKNNDAYWRWLINSTIEKQARRAIARSGGSK